jgi:hypothetical protein
MNNFVLLAWPVDKYPSIQILYTALLDTLEIKNLFFSCFEN